MVGETGFEPATLASQTPCATGLRHSPISQAGILPEKTGLADSKGAAAEEATAFR